MLRAGRFRGQGGRCRRGGSRAASACRDTRPMADCGAQWLAWPVLAGTSAGGGHAAWPGGLRPGVGRRPARAVARAAGRCRRPGGAAPVAPGHHRPAALPGDAGTAELLPHGHHRPPVARRLRRPRRLGRAASRAGVDAHRAAARGGAFGPARARRRGLSGRHQVAHRGPHRRAWRRRAEVRGLQCRRRRFRHLCRPHGDGGRPLHADRGHGDCCAGGGRHAGHRLHPRRIPRRPGGDGRGDRPRHRCRLAGRARARQRTRFSPAGLQGRRLLRVR